MKPNFFQKCLSFIKEVPLETRTSEFNEVLHVSLIKNTLQLCSKNAIYSYGEKYDNFYKTFVAIPEKLEKVESVLVLGLGLGSIPYMLEEKLDYDFDYTFVEIDEEVIDLANEYTLQYLESMQQTFCADAYIFLQQFAQKHDMICVDIFLDDIIPDTFKKTDFLQLCKKRLNKKGFVLYNFLTINDQDIENAKAFFELFKTVFPKSSYKDVGGNWIFIGEG
ncbi:MAG: fused MFS/spermidine synthase [Saprospiraceae bacterium]|nr:fused MFS/spermidine synthase [Saprospiraceae bacterium]